MAVYKYNLIAGCCIKNTSIYNNLFFIYTILLYIWQLYYICEKAEELKYTHEYIFTDALKETVQWYR